MHLHAMRQRVMHLHVMLRRATLRPAMDRRVTARRKAHLVSVQAEGGIRPLRFPCRQWYADVS